MTDFVERLKQKLLEDDDRAVFFERMTLLTEAEKKYRNEGNGKKYVLCFEHMLKNMTVDILPDELIVGIAKEIHMDDAQEAQFAEASKRYNFKATELFTFDPLQIIEITDSDERFAPEWFSSYGHMIPDFNKLLKTGYGGLGREAWERLQDTSLSAEQKDFLENCIIACNAMIVFAGRYAALARSRMQDTADAEEKQRYARICAACERCAETGADSFRAALQLLWFTMLVLQTVCGARDYAYGRIDQYLYPYYEKDIRAGVITRQEALELIECLFIKSNEIIGYTWEAYKPKRIMSVNSLQYVLLSGSDEKGNDTTNEVSWLVLEAMDRLKIKQPTVNIRYHENIDRGFYEYACKIAASGLGYPSFFNDATVYQALIANGVCKENAVDYGYYGCNNSFLPGHEDELREAWHCMPKYLEFALNRGACMLTGRAIGAVTPSAHKINSMDELCSALRIQIADGIAKAKKHVERSDAYWNELKPFSFESVIMTDCIRKASSMNDNGSLQRHINNHLVGLATAANSLYAIQKLVFEQKKYTLTEFAELLKSDWKGEEYTREYVRGRFAKFGNDIDEVDSIAKRISLMFVEEVRRASPAENGRVLYPSIYSLWHHREFGKHCAASADGRRAGEELSESQSPVYGTEENGPTAMFNSIARLPLQLTPSGGINVKFQPKLFEGPEGHKNLAALIEGYFKKGGMHVQINVISKQKLIDAQMHPENYKNLLVRVVGYSAYFVTLSPAQQQEIIDRTEL